MIREAQAYDCGPVSRRLRKGHLTLLAGRNVHRDLREAFDGSSVRLAWEEDGKVLAIGGFMGTALEFEASAWLAVTEEATRFPVGLARRLIREVERAFVVRRRLNTFVLADDDKAKRLAYFLGFRGEEPATLGGLQAVKMTLEP